MPYRFTIDDQTETVFFHAEGELTPFDFLACLNDVVAHPGFQPGFNHLVDLTCCTRLAFSAQHMRQRTDADRKLADKLGSGRYAMLTNSFFSYAVTRIYKTLMRDGPLEISLFRELYHAYAWLGIVPSDNPYKQCSGNIWMTNFSRIQLK